MDEKDLQDYVRFKTAELEAELDKAEAASKPAQAEASDLDRQEAEELAAVPRSLYAAEQRRMIRAKYSALRAERGELKLSEEGQYLADRRAQVDSSLYGFPERMDSREDLERAYLKAKSSIRPGDLIQLSKLKRAYREAFGKIGYQLND